MLSKSNQQLIRSLQQSKFRTQHKQFIAEGIKTIKDLVKHGFALRYLVTCNEFKLHDILISNQTEHVVTNRDTMERISALTTPPGILGVFELPEMKTSNQPAISQWSLVLDGIKDPGNMGTLIRTAHWFGIEKIYLANSNVDIFAPKTVQSSMGSIGAISIEKIEHIEKWAQQAQISGCPLYATTLLGKPLQQFKPIQPGAIIMGSESHGIDREWEKHISQNLHILSLSKDPPDSLNVAVAAGIVLHYVCNPEIK